MEGDEIGATIRHLYHELECVNKKNSELVQELNDHALHNRVISKKINFWRDRALRLETAIVQSGRKIDAKRKSIESFIIPSGVKKKTKKPKRRVDDDSWTETAGVKKKKKLKRRVDDSSSTETSD